MRIFRTPCTLVPKDETIVFSSEKIKNPIFRIMDDITFKIKKVEMYSIEAEIEIKVEKEDYSAIQGQKNLVDFGLDTEDQKIFKKEFLKLQTWFGFNNLDLSYDSKDLKMFVPKGTLITRHASLRIEGLISGEVEIKSLKVEKFFKEANLSPATEYVLEINKLKEMIKNFKETTSELLEGEEKLVIPPIFFWICRIYFQQRNLNEVPEREYDVIFNLGIDYLKGRSLDFGQIVGKILNSGNKIKKHSYDENEDKQHIDIAFDLDLKENSDQFHDLAILRPIRNLAVHFYESSIENSKNEKDNLINFITSQTDNYVSITEKMVKKYSEIVAIEHKKFFENTGRYIEIIR